MELDLHTKQQLASLLAKPAMVTHAHADMLTELVKAYPYYQPLHLLLAKANHNTTKDDHLATAALYNGGGLLHQVVYHPETLHYTRVNIINSDIAENQSENSESTTPVATEENDNEIHEEINEIVVPTNKQVDVKASTLADEQEVHEEISEIIPVTKFEDSQENVDEHSINFDITDEQEVHEEIADINHVTTFEEEQIFDEEPEETLVKTPEIADEQEIHDEIAEVNYHQPIEEKELGLKKEPEKETPNTFEENLDDQEIFEEIAEINQAHFPPPIEEERPKKMPLPKFLRGDLNDLEMESIIDTDFFAFERKISVEQTPPQKTVLQPEEYSVDAEAQTVSKYYDDKLPYTFLWWLAKTRKEHEQIFQPYVTPKKNNNPNPLQQQYVEHIFHLQTPFNEAEEIARGPINNHITHKGDDIIDSFIKNEPQIRAPKAEQINNENKAKKSAEDNYDLVSETLAAIYIEQMLYHKAIDTYEKLSLKFPEKSRYFADLIQSLEKKI